MTLEYREDASGRVEPVATACPYCGVEIAEGNGLVHHLPCDAVPSTEEVARR